MAKILQSELVLSLKFNASLNVKKSGWKPVDEAIASNDLALRVEIRYSGTTLLERDIHPSVCKGSSRLLRDGGTVSIDASFTASYALPAAVTAAVRPHLPADVWLVAIVDADFNAWPLKPEGVGIVVGSADIVVPQISSPDLPTHKKVSARDRIPDFLASAVLQARVSRDKVFARKRGTWRCALSGDVRVAFDGNPDDEDGSPNPDSETYVVTVDAGSSTVTFFADIDGCTSDTPRADIEYIKERFLADFDEQAVTARLSKKSLETLLIQKLKVSELE